MPENHTLKRLYKGRFSGTKDSMNSFLLNAKNIILDPRTRLWAIIVIVSITLTAGLYFLSPKNQTLPTVKNADPSILSLKENDWVRGDSTKAKSVLIEYGDFQCPSCGVYYSVVKQLETDLGDDVAVVFRHFPLTAIHPNAQLAAQAAEAAGVQGKFFEMHDMLFTEQKVWSNESNAAEIFVGYAQKLGLNVDQFKTDLYSSAVKDKIAASVKDGGTLGLRGTPSFFLNGKELPQAKSYAEFKQSIVSQTYTQ